MKVPRPLALGKCSLPIGTFGARRLFALLLAVIAVGLMAADNKPGPDQAAPKNADQAKAGPPPQAHIILVPLPIKGSADTRVKRLIDQAMNASSDTQRRPVLILEFRSEEGKTGEGSEYERALSLARFLARSELSRARVVAFLPQSVRGHAVLAALACEEIIMAEEAELGEAGIDESSIDASMRAAYQDIAQRRRTIPASVALAMLDKERAVFKVETQDGVRFADGDDELERIKKNSVVIRSDRMSRAGDFAKFSGRDLRLKYGFVSHLASDHAGLARALRLPPESLRTAGEADREWKAVRVELRGRVNAKKVQDIQQSLDSRLKTGDVNLICLIIDSPGGAPADSVQLANYLADLDGSEIRTVAYVSKKALGDASLPALACDQLVVNDGVLLGGPGDHVLSDQERDDLRDPIIAIAKAKGRDWSLMLGLQDQQLRVFRYEREGGSKPRYFCVEELDLQEDPGEWKRSGELDLSGGVGAARGEELGLVHNIAASFDEVHQIFHVDQFEEVKPSRIVTVIERWASQAWVARTLLFIAFFAFISEASAPGLGAAGFVSALCFLLFFWIQFLNGTAGWLEVVLFVGGVMCIAVEVLLVPGFGVFGIGGLAMVLGSILLATQTFVIPRNSYQYQQLPGSLFTVIAAMGGTFVALVAMRKLLPNAPIFRRMMLDAPEGEQIHHLSRRESLVDFGHLVHKSGLTTTQLTPSGKAIIAGDVVNVISRGELIPVGVEVLVTEVHGNRIIVEPVDDATSG